MGEKYVVMKQNNITLMSYKGITQALLNEIGFTGINDLDASVFAFKFPIFGTMIATIVATMSELINQYVYTPAQGIILLIAVTAADVVLGIGYAVKKKEGVSSARLMRAFVRLVIQMFFVGVFFEMSTIWNTFIGKWMVDALLILFTLSTFWSAIKNARGLGLITDDQYSILETAIGLKKIFSKFTKVGDDKKK